MKPSHPRRATTLRPSSASPLLPDSSSDPSAASRSAALWLLLHVLCCLASLLLGFRFSRLVYYLLFSTPILQHQSIPIPLSHTAILTPPPPPPPHHHNLTKSRVVVGRHGIRIRPWPHPNPTEVMRAHRIIDRVQREQRLLYAAGGGARGRRLLVVTPTYARTFQALHLTGLAHSLMLLPYDLTWIVVEAAGLSHETKSLIDRSGLPLLHIPFRHPMPADWPDRHRMEARMRLHALRVIRERRLDGIVVFADDSNMHSLELFDEIQNVKWMGALSVGILAHTGRSADNVPPQQEEKGNTLLPIQGPACNSSGQLVGWHTFNSLPYMNTSATYVGEGATVLPTKLEWAGFVLNSRLLWKEAAGKPDWVRDLDAVGENGEEIESPLALLKDASFVEPMGNCGKKVMLWWLRVEARADSKFPPGWIIKPPLDITVPAKRTPWPHAPLDPEIVAEKINTNEDHVEKHSSGTSRSSRPKRSSRKKRHDSHDDAHVSSVSEKQKN